MAPLYPSHERPDIVIREAAPDRRDKAISGEAQTSPIEARRSSAEGTAQNHARRRQSQINEPSLVFSSSAESARSCSSIDCSSLNVSSDGPGRSKNSTSAPKKQSGWPRKGSSSDEQPWHGMGSYRSGDDWENAERPKNKARAMSKGIKGFEAAMVEAGHDSHSGEDHERQRSLSEKRETFNKDLDDCLSEETSTK